MENLVNSKLQVVFLEGGKRIIVFTDEAQRQELPVFKFTLEADEKVRLLTISTTGFVIVESK